MPEAHAHAYTNTEPSKSAKLGKQANLRLDEDLCISGGTVITPWRCVGDELCAAAELFSGAERQTMEPCGERALQTVMSIRSANSSSRHYRTRSVYSKQPFAKLGK